MALNPSARAPDRCAVEMRGIVKDFFVGLRGSRVRALDHLDLRVAAGQIFGLLGPNGSGKSTAIRVLLGLIQPTRGEARLFGLPGTDIHARRAVGYLPESPRFHEYLSGRELVRFHGRLCGLQRASLHARVEAVLAWVGLGEAADRRVEAYSRGMLQRLGLAQALVHDPMLLVLDEPTAGVDPAGAADMMALIRRLKAEGRTILLTSHLLGQVEEICDRVGILDRGRLLLEGSLQELVGDADHRWLNLGSLSAVELDELHSWLVARGHPAATLSAGPARLDRIYLNRVAGNPP